MPILMKERDTSQCWVCPYCSKDYPSRDEEDKADNEMPVKCRRCGSPMDTKEARMFANQRAKDAHDPAVHQWASLMRGGADYARAGDTE